MLPQRTRFKRPAGLSVVELDVIGVYDSEQAGAMGFAIHVPLNIGKRLQKAYGFPRAPKRGRYLKAVVKVSDLFEMQRIRAAIEGQGYETQTILDVLGKLADVFLLFKFLLSVFGSVGLFVAFFGIANTMVMAVLERTREIGALKALGARQRDIRRLFLVEAASIGLLGGAFGLALGLSSP